MRLCGTDRFPRLTRMKRCGALFFLVLVSMVGCRAFLVPYACVFGYEIWVYASGEQAIDRHWHVLGIRAEKARELIYKRERGEPLTGRNVELSTRTDEIDALRDAGEPLQRHISMRRNCDEEWEYSCATVYFYKGRIVDVRFKENSGDPQPIYRYHGHEYSS